MLVLNKGIRLFQLAISLSTYLVLGFGARRPYRPPSFADAELRFYVDKVTSGEHDLIRRKLAFYVDNKPEELVDCVKLLKLDTVREIVVHNRG